METHETQVHYWGLMRVIETAGDTGNSENYCGLMILMRIINSWGIMNLRETIGDL